MDTPILNYYRTFCNLDLEFTEDGSRLKKSVAKNLRMLGLKYCPKCKGILRISEFNGRAYCIPCKREDDRVRATRRRKEIRAWLRGDRDINAPQPAEMRHGDAIKMFQLKRVEGEKSARPKMGYLTAILCVFLAAFLAGGYMLLVNTNLLR